jgi:hypothetical protein
MMKRLLILLMVLQLGLFGQKWRKVNQKYYGMTYELPSSWEVDGFGADDDWEQNGSSVCDCAGSINIGNRFQPDEIYMVVYPTKIRDSVNASKRLKVWEMVFDTTGAKSEVKTKNLSFRKIVSKWTKETAGEYADNEVWRLKAEFKNQYYILYFWAKPNVIKKNLCLLNKILESFKPVD